MNPNSVIPAPYPHLRPYPRPGKMKAMKAEWRADDAVELPPAWNEET